MACGKVIDIVVANVAEIRHERVEQALGWSLNPHVEKPEIRRIAREDWNYATSISLIEMT
jgi:hypothetical protein